MMKIVYVVSLAVLVLISVSAFVFVPAIQGKEVEIVPISEVDRSGFDGAVKMPDVNHEVHDDQQTYEWLQENKIKFRGKTLP